MSAIDDENIVSPKVVAVLDALSVSGMSAAAAVVDCLYAIAGNGPDYADDESMLCNAELLRDAAQRVITALSPNNPEIKNRGQRLELHAFHDRPLTREEAAYLEAAKLQQVDGELEFDDFTVVSIGDFSPGTLEDGAYVLGWVWVERPAALDAKLPTDNGVVPAYISQDKETGRTSCDDPNLSNSGKPDQEDSTC